MSFHGFHDFTFTVADSQVGEMKPCVSFLRVKLSQMNADLQKPRKFNPTKVKVYTVYISRWNFT